MDGWVDRWMDGWMDRSIDEMMGGWMDGWTYGRKCEMSQMKPKVRKRTLHQNQEDISTLLLCDF